MLPVSSVGPDRDRPDVLAVCSQPLPLVVDFWSPSTGLYDFDTKYVEYRRGDAEIWRMHHFDRTLIEWPRQPRGRYVKSIQTGGTIDPIARPGVTVDLDALFAS